MGIFNKWDLKTHPNITSNFQQSKLRLASIHLLKLDVILQNRWNLEPNKCQQQIKSAYSLTQKNIKEDNEHEKK